ncbi:MAG: cation transporter, partial [Pseudomonadota bacterium]|nr:cation transporter [Pseudomonadota bacterium]
MQTASLATTFLPERKRAEAAEPPVDSAPASLGLLDDPQEWSAFSRPVQGQADCWESHLVIEDMHCAACALTVEDALRGVPGVASASVSAGSHRARVVWQADAVQPSGWMQAVLKAGYRAVPANDAFANQRRRQETRKALWRWSVAGLCMMQVMMYAWPAYVALPGDLSAEMEQLLRWASWVLTLPVMLFSCGPFFSAALRDVAQRRISMDLPVALGMGITFVVSTAGTFDPQGIFGKEVYFDSLTMFVFFLLTGRWLELRLRDRTAGALDALMNRLPDSVERQRADGMFERVAVRRLKAGDVVRILPGEAFPADGTVLQGQTLADEALLTGESRPIPRGAGEAVIAGSHNLAAS